MALAPRPSATPAVPEPATTDTIPEERTRARRTKLPTSVMYRICWLLLRATPKAPVNLFVPSAPCTFPGDPGCPAILDTTPAGVTLRTVAPSPTYMLPAASMSMPLGPEKAAAAPVPSAKPLTPLPAMVATVPAAVKVLTRKAL